MYIKPSKMFGKLQGIQAINSNPLSNNFCQAMRKKNTICTNCYSFKMLKTFRANCINAFQHNSKLLSKNLLDIIQLPHLTTNYIRFNAHGELINYIHFVNLVMITEKYNNKTFALWTKRIDIINQFCNNGFKIPKNLKLIYSNPYIDKDIKIPKNFNIVFNVATSDKKINCKLKCIDCLKCYKQDKKQVYELLRTKIHGKRNFNNVSK